jgi:hypothetical protein
MKVRNDVIIWGYNVVWLVAIFWKSLMHWSVSWFHKPHHNINNYQQESVIFVCLWVNVFSSVYRNVGTDRNFDLGLQVGQPIMYIRGQYLEILIY